MITANASDALRGLRHAVDLKGRDYIYEAPDPDVPTCVYAWRDPDTHQLVPSCVVGHALHHLGVPLNLMYECGNEEQVHSLVDRLLLKLGVEVVTPAALECFREAQRVQDAALDGFDTEGNRIEDCSWGAALDAACAAAPAGGTT